MKLINQILVPDNTQYEYDSFHIQENNLRVILIKDPTAQISCSCMNVNIGNMYDTVAGIAHFLEHMLFMGNSKYEDEAIFTKFITNNAGYTNAYTGDLNTCYYFTIQSEKFYEALDMFGNFFIQPLLKKDSVDRELNAVHSEHQNNISNDMWKKYDLIRECIMDDHGNKKFGTGCNETLKIENIHDKLKEFYNNYYSPDLMTLIILDNQNLDIMKQNIIEIFSQILPKQYKQPDCRITGKMFIDSNNRFIKMYPNEDKNMLSLYWDVRSFKDTALYNPNPFICHILGSEVENSLYYHLLNLNYIVSLSFGNSYINDRTLLMMDIELTPEGQNNLNEIINIVYNYIETFKNTNRELLKVLYEEMINMEKIEFEFSNVIKPEYYVLNIISRIQQFDLDKKHILAYSSCLKSFNEIENNLKENLNLMTLNNNIIINSSKKYQEEAILQAQFYDTKYVITNIDIFEFTKINLPFIGVNQFIPQNLDIIKENLLDYPIQLDHKLDVYHMGCNKFNVPKIAIKFIAYANLDSLTGYYNGLYIDSIMKQINDSIYMAQNAGYEIGVYPNYQVVNQLIISINGYSDKIYDVCHMIMSALLDCSVGDDIFENTKYDTINSLNNSYSRSPYKQIRNILHKNLVKNNLENNQIAECLEYANQENCKKAFTEYINSCSSTILVCGNTDVELTTKIADLFGLFNNSKTGIKQNIYTEKYNDGIIRNSNNSFEKNSASSQFVLVDSNIKNIAFMKLLDMLIGDKYFDTLRTKETFGYIVYAGSFGIYYYPDMLKYIELTTQSPTKSTNEIVDRTNKFLDEFFEYIKEILTVEFEEIKNSCIKLVSKPFLNIVDFSNYYFEQIFENSFDRNILIIQELEKMTKTEFVNYYENIFITNKKSITISLNCHN